MPENCFERIRFGIAIDTSGRKRAPAGSVICSTIDCFPATNSGRVRFRYGSGAPVRVAPNRSFIEGLPSQRAECAVPRVKRSYGLTKAERQVTAAAVVRSIDGE